MPQRCTFAELEGHTIKKVKVAEVTRDCSDDPAGVFQVYEFELEDGTKKYFYMDPGDLEGFYATAGSYRDPLPIRPLPNPLPRDPGDHWTEGPFLFKDFSEDAPSA